MFSVPSGIVAAVPDSHVGAQGSLTEHGEVSVRRSLSKLLSGRQSCSPGVICCFHVAISVVKCVFTISPSVNMLKNGNYMPEQDIAILWCVHVCLQPAMHHHNVVHRLAPGHVSNVNVSIRCNLGHFHFPAHSKKSSHFFS